MLGDDPGRPGGIVDETVRVNGKLERSRLAGIEDTPDIPEELKIRQGSVIGDQYEVRRVLGGEGRSGMGVVYICYDRRAGQYYALKTFQDRFIFSDRIKDNFKNEALAWVLLDPHPNIVQAISVEAHDNRLFIVLEYIEPDGAGRNTLTHYLKSPISRVQAVEWAIQFCDGMAYAASQGVTPHRDIKPDNLMIARDGTLKITDFGLARFWEGTLSSCDPDEYGEDAMAGTSPWTAPEQFDGLSDLRSDIYSFGIILYQMVGGGRLPFSGDSLEEYRRLHCEAPVPRLVSRLYPIIRKCLNKSPSRRYEDFSALRSDLVLLYRALTRAEPPALATRIEPGMWEYNNRGLALYNVGLVDEAIWVYRKALRACPEHANIGPQLAIIHDNLGVAYDARGQQDLAISEYREALRLDPALADAHNNLGTALRAKGVIDEAKREYLEALKLNPGHAIARYNLGLSFACQGELDKAIASYKEALSVSPGMVGARINMGLAFAMKGRPERAIAEYKKAARLTPDDPLLRFNLAGALRAAGRADEAIAEYRAVLRLDPANAEARYRIGLTLQESGLAQDAINEYIAALRLYPGHGPALACLEAALLATGMSGAAVDACLELLSGKDRR